MSGNSSRKLLVFISINYRIKYSLDKAVGKQSENRLIDGSMNSNVDVKLNSNYRDTVTS